MKTLAFSVLLAVATQAAAGWQEDADKICRVIETDAPNFCATALDREAAYMLIQDAGDTMDLIDRCVGSKIISHGPDTVTASGVRCCVKELAMAEAGFPDYRCETKD
ncbi:MAG: hypothetical protein OXC38_00525 [Gammaproteobacteria bacterium]|nr:hypothetical protein [Gammaproteobacteria bacterium]